MATVVDAIKGKLKSLTKSLERELDADVVGIFGPITGGVDHHVRRAIEALSQRRDRLAVVLQTGGGSIEITERIVNVLRHYYPDDVRFVVPDVALSAGTILAMSGDAILMDFFSCLGPIDPQLEKEGKFVPVLSYLEQYNRLVSKSSKGQLTTAELSLLDKLDLAELHQYEQAVWMTVDLLVQWLAKYKFKDWTVTQGRGIPVTQQMREDRAKDIAVALNKQDRWRSHGRGIPMQTLRDELNLVIDDFGKRPALARAIRDYQSFVLNCMVKEKLTNVVISREDV